jgi:demethylmenaquinone methyltransferase / 2-methoxy-6-polyprenyl-1,4-benzoquinol methylase
MVRASSPEAGGAALTGREREAYVGAMFDKIAAPYDRLNRLISLGRDGAWRATAVRMAGIGPGARVVDVGCGTGDFILAALEAMRGEGSVVGLDLAPNMVEIARQKTARAPGGASVEIRTGNAAATGVPDRWADAVTMGWVVRNLGDRHASYSEVMRVLKPGGRFVCLETSRPSSAVMRAGLAVWLHGVMPVLVRLSGGDREAYRYLAASTERFLTANELAAELSSAGFASVAFKKLMGGAIAIHVATKAGVAG